MQTPISPDTLTAALTAAPGTASRLRADPLAAAGYITDVAHIHQYYSHLAPVMVSYAAALNGGAPAPLGDFDYCEIGCGNGLSLNLHAAVHPDARFVGIDVNPEQIANARRLAEAGGLANVRYLALDVASAEREALPEFDYITLHGVYARVREDVRQGIAAFIGRRLKPGGFALVSYNALPGWAGLEPLREMMRAYTAGVPGIGSLERARRGLEYVRYMAERNAGYFAHQPGAKVLAEHLQGFDLRYIAHEYFNEHWTPLYFSQVAREMKEVGLAYAGSLPVETNYLEATVLPAFQELIRSAPSRTLAETHKDFVRDPRFRIDVYARAGAAAAPAEASALFAGFAFALTRPAEHTPLQGRAGEMDFTLQGALFPLLIAALAAGPRTLAELRADPQLADFDAADMLAALQQMVLVHAALPALRSAPPYPGAGAALGLSRFNCALLEYKLGSDDADELGLASSLLGTAVQLPRSEALVWMALAAAGRDRAADWLIAWLKARRASLLQPGPGGATDSGPVRTALAAADEPKRQVLHAMGVLEAVAPPG
ncbi:MAG: methyltransferase domain-containing protein [Gammaproteobacteria bacterium]|nr:methyltransferase domain-containing protein [Gammaproteobacteria bacterium]